MGYERRFGGGGAASAGGGLSLFRKTGLSVANGTSYWDFTIDGFTTDRNDLGLVWDDAEGGLLIPSAMTLEVVMNLEWAAHATGIRGGRITDSVTTRKSQSRINATSAGTTNQSIVHQAALEDGDFIYFDSREQTSGGALNLATYISVIQIA